MLVFLYDCMFRVFNLLHSPNYTLLRVLQLADYILVSLSLLIQHLTHGIYLWMKLFILLLKYDLFLQTILIVLIQTLIVFLQWLYCTSQLTNLLLVIPKRAFHSCNSLINLLIFLDDLSDFNHQLLILKLQLQLPPLLPLLILPSFTPLIKQHTISLYCTISNNTLITDLPNPSILPPILIF